MVTTAHFSEQARLQGRTRHTIAEILSQAKSTGSSDDDLSVEEIAFIKKIWKAGGLGGNGSSTGKSKAPPSGGGGGGPKNVPKCFLCLYTGHKANECRLRERERTEGKWRRNKNEQIITKEEFDKLPLGSRQAPRTYVGAAPTGDTVRTIDEEAQYNTYLNGRSSN